MKRQPWFAALLLWASVRGLIAQTNCVQLPYGYSFVAGYIDPPTYHRIVPWTTQVVKPNPLTGDFDSYYYKEDWDIWIPSWPTPPPPGFGWMILAPYSFSLCFSNDLPPPILPLDLPPGFSLVCCQSMQPARFEDIVGRPPDADTRLYRFMNISLWPTNIDDSNFLTFAFTNGAWSPSNPIVPIHEAVWVLQPPRISNAQIVSNRFQFVVRTATYATLHVEYADALDGAASWKPLTSFAGWGYMTNVVNDLATNGAPQRLYRLRLAPRWPTY